MDGTSILMTSLFVEINLAFTVPIGFKGKFSSKVGVLQHMKGDMQFQIAGYECNLQISS